MLTAFTTADEFKEMIEAQAQQQAAQAALEAGDIDPSNEQESREMCEKIMFEKEAPQEKKPQLKPGAFEDEEDASVETV